MKRLWSGLLALTLLVMAGHALAEGDFSEAYADKFLTESVIPVVTETTYRSRNIAIEITGQRYVGSDTYIADIYIRSMDRFQRYYAKGDWSTGTREVPTMAAASGAVLAMTGDSSQNFNSGWVVGNGVVERDGSRKINIKRDICIVYKNGEMRTVLAPSKEEGIALAGEAEDIWHIFLFGPALLDEAGRAYPRESFEERTNPHPVTYANPRSVLGYYAPGHYCFVQVDGRQTDSKLAPGEKNGGVRLEDLAALMESLGCKAAYNLDGGRSSMLWFDGGLISTPKAWDRRIGDILVIMEE